MHAPRPFGLECDAPLDAVDLAAVEKLARDVTNFKQLSQLDSAKRSITLSDGRVATASDMGGIFKVAVSPLRADDRQPETAGLAHGRMPMLFSGAADNGLVRESGGLPLRLTETTRRRLAGYRADNLPAAEQSLMRFVIGLPEHLRYLRQENTGIFTQTQFWKLRPTWYSGSMASVVQCVSGFGRSDFDNLPDNAVERAQFVLPDAVLNAALSELGDTRLPACLGVPPPSGQVAFGYTAKSTDGVAFDGNGVPWLLNVSARGVLAMPLPLIPVTTTAAFRDYAVRVNDDELLYLLDTFGGVPSGETFPKDKDAWLRAGAVVKLCDTADFYKHRPVYDACGWSFNTRASEAFNTCFEYDGKGLMQVHGYGISLRLGGVDAHGADKFGRVAGQGVPAGLSGYLARVLADLPFDDYGRAIRYKIRRASSADLSARAAGFVGAAVELDYWDGLVLPPIASASGQCRRLFSGAVYRHHADKVKCVPELKFPTLDAKGCASFELDLEKYIRDGGRPVACDTVVWGGFVGDTLRVVRYFFDDAKTVKTVESNFDDVMIVGSWEQTETGGAAGLVGSLYTSDFDDRTESAPTVVTTKIVGRDLGYGKPLYQTPPLFYRVGSVSRARYYSTVTETEAVGGGSAATAVCVPVFARDALLYGFKQSANWKTWEKAGVKNSVKDPYSYQMWTHSDKYHWRGATLNGNKGSPYPKDGKPVYVDTELYNPTPYSDFADNGSWLKPVEDVTSTVGSYTSGNTQHGEGVSIGGESPPYREFHEKKRWDNDVSGCVKITASFADGKTVHENVPHGWYFDVSPVADENGGLSYFWRDVCSNACGAAEYGNMDETRDNGRRYAWGRCSPADDTAAYYFLGVVNG